MRIVLVIFGILATLIVASLIQGGTAARRLMWSPAMKQVHAAKTGRVIELKTGQGIPQATVVVTGYYTAEFNRASIGALFQPLGHGQGGYARGVLYTLGTQTDSEGNFSFPDTRDASWEAIKNVSGPLANYTLSAGWKIDVLKPGFAPEGSEIARSFDKYDFPMHPHFHPQGAMPVSYDPPKFKHANDVIEIDAIKVSDLKDLQLSPKEEIVFYHEQYLSASPDHRYILGQQIVHIGKPISGPMEKEDPRRLIFDRLKELACTANPGSEMGSSEIEAYVYFAPDSRNFLRALQELDPAGFQKAGAISVMKSGYDHPIFHTGNVCKSFSND